MKKHHSKPHSTTANIFLAASRVRKQLQQEQDAALESNWYMNLGVSILAFREITGDNKKTERFARRLNEMLKEARDYGMTTAEVLAEVEKVTGIELIAEDDNGKKDITG